MNKCFLSGYLVLTWLSVQCCRAQQLAVMAGTTYYVMEDQFEQRPGLDALFRFSVHPGRMSIGIEGRHSARYYVVHPSFPGYNVARAITTSRSLGLGMQLGFDAIRTSNSCLTPFVGLEVLLPYRTDLSTTFQDGSNVMQRDVPFEYLTGIGVRGGIRFTHEIYPKVGLVMDLGSSLRLTDIYVSTADHFNSNTPSLANDKVGVFALLGCFWVVKGSRRASPSPTG